MDDEQERQPNSPVLETVSFPFDRMTVARFRETFPKARWSDRLQAWTVPGSTARRRIDQWLASEADRKAPFEEERGRDLFEFEPILSPYLEVHGGGLRVRTPYPVRSLTSFDRFPTPAGTVRPKLGKCPLHSMRNYSSDGKLLKMLQNGPNQRKDAREPKPKRARRKKPGQSGVRRNAERKDFRLQVAKCRP